MNRFCSVLLVSFSFSIAQTVGSTIDVAVVYKASYGKWGLDMIHEPLDFLQAQINDAFGGVKLANVTLTLNLTYHRVDITASSLNGDLLRSLQDNTYIGIVIYGVPAQFFAPLKSNPVKPIIISGYNLVDFANLPEDSFQTAKPIGGAPRYFQTLAAFARKRNAKRVAFLRGDTWGFFTDAMVEAFANEKITVAIKKDVPDEKLYFLNTSMDGSSGGKTWAEDIIESIAQAQPDLVCSFLQAMAGDDIDQTDPLFQRPEITLVNLMKRHKINPKGWYWWILPTEQAWVDGLGEDGDYVLAAVQWHYTVNFPDPLWGSSKAMVAAYQRVHNSDINNPMPYVKALSMVAPYILVAAIGKMKSWSHTDFAKNRDALRLELYRNKFDSFFGPVQFAGDNRNAYGEAIWVQRQNGVLRVVLPETAAERTLSWPMPSWDSRSGCEAGKYNTGLECKDCPPNTFSNSTNARVCSTCPMGQGQKLPGQTSCEDCESGTFNPGESSAGCRFCPTGSFSNLSKTDTCQKCPIGAFQGKQGSRSCLTCGQGETTAVIGAEGNSECICQTGYYYNYHNLVTQDEAPSSRNHSGCKKCIDALFDCKGRDQQPLVKAGFYIKGYDHLDIQNNIAVYECTPRKSCPGGGPSSCEAHRVGTACGTCDNNYARNNDGNCRKCQFSGHPAVYVIIVLLALVPFSAVFYSKTYYDDPKKERSSGSKTMMMPLGNGGPNSSYCNFVINSNTSQSALGGIVGSETNTCFLANAKSFVSGKTEGAMRAEDPNKAFLIILSFFQHVGVITQFNLALDSNVATLMGLSRYVMLDPSILSLPCWGIKSFPAQLMMVYCIPLLLLLATTILHFTLRLFSRYGATLPFLQIDASGINYGRKTQWVRWFRRSFIDTTRGLGYIRIVATTCQIGSFFYVALAGLATTHLDCYLHPSGERSVRAYPYVHCGFGNGEEIHEWKNTIWISVFGVAVYIIAPFAASIFVTFHLQELDQRRRAGEATGDSDAIFRAAFKYVIGKYRIGVVWWESVWMTRNLILSILPALVPNVGQIQLLLYAVILILYIFAALAVVPWRRSANSKLDIAMTIVLLHIVTLVSIFYTFPVSNEDSYIAIARLTTEIILFMDLCAIVPALWFFGSRGVKKEHENSKRFSTMFQSSRRLPNIFGSESMMRRLSSASCIDPNRNLPFDLSAKQLDKHTESPVEPSTRAEEHKDGDEDPFSEGEEEGSVFSQAGSSEFQDDDIAER